MHVSLAGFARSNARNKTFTDKAVPSSPTKGSQSDPQSVKLSGSRSVEHTPPTSATSSPTDLMDNWLNSKRDIKSLGNSPNKALSRSSSFQEIISSQGSSPDLSYQSSPQLPVVKSLETYEQFLDKLIKSKHLRLCIEGFCNNFEKKQSKPKEHPEIINSFIEQTRSAITKDPQWSSVDERELEISTFKHFRTHLIRKLFNSIFFTTEGYDKDKEFTLSLKKLQFIQPKHLDLPNQYDELLKDCIEQLQDINSYFLPEEKLSCLMRFCRKLVKMLSDSIEGEGITNTSADSMIPNMVYAVIKAQVPFLLSNFEFITRFSEPNPYTEEAYYFTQFNSVLYFLQNAKPSHFTIEQAEYESLSNQATRELQDTPLQVERPIVSWSDKERQVTDQSMKDMLKYQSHDDKSLEEIFPYMRYSAADLKESDLPRLLNEYQNLVRSINAAQASDILKSRNIKVIKVRERGKNMFRKIQIQTPMPFLTLKKLIEDKILAHIKDAEISQIISLPDCEICDDEDVSLIENNQQIELVLKLSVQLHTIENNKTGIS